MKESVIKSIMRLFAIVAQTHRIDEASVVKKIVEQYLLLNVRDNKIRQYQIMYDFYYNSLREREVKTGEKQLSLLSVKSVIICDQINEHLTRTQKILILAFLLEIISLIESYNEEDIDFVKTISIGLRIKEDVFYDVLAFISNRFELSRNPDRILEINSKGENNNGFRYSFRDFIEGSLLFIFLEESKVCLFKNIEKDNLLFLNDSPVELNQVYFFTQGSVVKSPLVGSIFYMDVIQIFLHDPTVLPVHFAVDNVAYRFKNSKEGIRPFSLIEESGRLIGILGGSGVGKSTLLNILNGSIKPHTGQIFINGYNIHDEREYVNGLIGYIPQDDTLIEELTVFQNLYFNARLCFRNLPKYEILKRVNRLLLSLDLQDIKDLQVGNILKKLISGGQRKRLNIALELVREPQILFVDEPTSGLSSTDSDNVMEILKLQSLKGKLVFVNIHQPSSDIFKKFDKIIVMDKGGRIVFQGPPLDSVIFVKTYQQLVNADEGECPTCGNLNPEQLLQILEMKKVDEFGDFTSKRLVNPEEWYENYIKVIKPSVNQATKIKLDLPEIEFKIPRRFTQFKIFSIRNLLAKLTDKQYLLINILEAPLLALILSWFTKYNAGTPSDPEAYVFYENLNLPIYIFISIVVALFLGLMVSAQEIIRDRKLLKREAFLHLNRFAYYNSKIVFLVLILAFQTFFYVLIGNYIVEIKGMFFPFWLMMWITSMAAGVLGLNLSASIKSVISIYILIPIILIPQIMLGGAMIQFDKINTKISNPEYVPFVGDIMPSRWAYEALMVYQFKENKYEKDLFRYDQYVSNASYMLNYFLPQMQSILSDIKGEVSQMHVQDYSIKKKFKTFSGGLKILEKQVKFCDAKFSELNIENFNFATFNELEKYLDCSKDYYIATFDKAVDERDKVFYGLEKKLGGNENLVKIRNRYTNESLSNIVLNKAETDKIVIYKDRFIRKADPIYFYPTNKMGRSQYYSPVKRVGTYYIDTYWFNFLMILFILLLFYFALIFEFFKYLDKQISRLSIKSFWK